MQNILSEAEKLREAGLTVETVGDVLDAMGPEQVTPPPLACFVPARLGDTPALPEPGIYFGMSDEEYHALPALSNSGIKYLAASPMLFWSRTPWLSEKKKRERDERLADEKVHHVMGKAYHCRIMEGAAAFERRFVVELDPADFPDALVHTDQIKAAIGRFTCEQPVKPCSSRKDELQAQLERLREANPQSIVVGMPPVEALKVEELKARIREYKETVPVKPVRTVTDTMPDTGEEYERAAVKADWIDQLLTLDPDAVVFDRVNAAFLAEHDGKAVVSAEQYQQLEIAAAMVERDPEVRHAFRGGRAEVVLIWHCPETGVPMKAKVDYLKVKAMVDLKSVANQRDRSIENAIRFEISSYHYNIQPAVYAEGAKIVRQLVREHGDKVIHTCFPDLSKVDVDHHKDNQNFALKWASHKGDDEWLWVFQQKGDAPITRGVFYPLAGTTHMITRDIVRSAKAKFRKFSEAFGTDPWLDVAPIYTIADEDIPQSATDI